MNIKFRPEAVSAPASQGDDAAKITTIKFGYEAVNSKCKPGVITFHQLYRHAAQSAEM